MYTHLHTNTLNTCIDMKHTHTCTHTQMYTLNTCINMHTHPYLYMHTYTGKHMCALMHTCMYTHAWTQRGTYIHTCTIHRHTHTYYTQARKHVYAHVCTHAHVWTHILCLCSHFQMDLGALRTKCFWLLSSLLGWSHAHTGTRGWETHL